MKHLLILLFVLCAGTASAQDVIVKKDGSTIVCRVVQVTATEITYKKWSDLNGSNYVMDKSLASGINYENGKIETFGGLQSTLNPNDQSNVVQSYNDRALLRIASDGERKAKRLRTIGWIGGGVLAATSLAFFSAGHDNTGEYYDFENDGGASITGLAFMGGAIVWTSSFLLAAKHAKNMYNDVQAYSVYQQDFQFSNGSSLSLCADLLKYRNYHSSNTLGLGLRYNF